LRRIRPLKLRRLKRKFARLYLDPAVVRRIKRVAIELLPAARPLRRGHRPLMLRKHGQPSAAEIAGNRNVV
jgi:hypothetical protein